MKCISMCLLYVRKLLLEKPSVWKCQWFTLWTSELEYYHNVIQELPVKWLEVSEVSELCINGQQSGTYFFFINIHIFAQNLFCETFSKMCTNGIGWNHRIVINIVYEKYRLFLL